MGVNMYFIYLVYRPVQLKGQCKWVGREAELLQHWVPWLHGLPLRLPWLRVGEGGWLGGQQQQLSLLLARH